MTPVMQLMIVAAMAEQHGYTDWGSEIADIAKSIKYDDFNATHCRDVLRDFIVELLRVKLFRFVELVQEVRDDLVG